MDGVTDYPFRHITKKYGNPDIMFTEFVSVDGLVREVPRLFQEFRYDAQDHPIVAQIFGTHPENFYRSTVLLCSMGFDGIDINMGCPAKSVEERGGGAGLIQNPLLAKQIIQSVQQAISDYHNGYQSPLFQSLFIPSSSIARPITCSVKTRIGYQHNEVESWILKLLEAQPDRIEIHGRTFTQQYGGKANWEAITQAALLCHQASVSCFGNGDIISFHDAQEKAARYQLDGILIGRASFGNPWVFQASPPDLSWTEKFNVMLEHARFYEHAYPDRFFLPMRKHLGWYVKGHPHAKELREQLYLTNSSQDVAKVLKKFTE
ncbi:MAG: tRNA-dihydrouridine synthase [Microgenomates group bacterium GW2011_GWF2_45_18]|nr:MAG: tRNA-dihydrouridine synthase [Microgenomates group bacterium GW2011_GWF2_45_18]OGJ41706.1 MAG: hypothetical protein A2378_02385 [Candidatus Pacebacteria bacterium RIFOXYB1_FULL_44_10]